MPGRRLSTPRKSRERRHSTVTRYSSRMSPASPRQSLAGKVQSPLRTSCTPSMTKRSSPTRPRSVAGVRPADASAGEDGQGEEDVTTLQRNASRAHAPEGVMIDDLAQDSGFLLAASPPRTHAL